MPRRHIGLGAESTYGTPVAATDFMYIDSESLARNDTHEELTSVSVNSTQAINRLTSSTGGGFEVIGNYNDSRLAFEHFFGSRTSAGAGTPYTHTFPATAGTTGRAGKMLTVEVKRDTTSMTWAYAGTKVVGWSLSMSKSQSPRLAFQCLGKSENSAATPSTLSLPVFEALKVHDCAVTFDAAAINLAAFDIQASWPVDEPMAVGSATFATEPRDLGPLTVEGTVTVLMLDTTEYASFDGTSEIDIQFVCDNGLATTLQRTLTINLNKTLLTAGPANFSGNDLIEVPFTFKSVFDATATENLQVILANADSTA